MSSKHCHGCDRPSHSLLTANCGHRTCFYCIKDNRSAQKCSKCVSLSSGSHNVSPLKNKSAEKSTHHMSQDTHVWGEPSYANNGPDTDRHIQSTQKK